MIGLLSYKCGYLCDAASIPAKTDLSEGIYEKLENKSNNRISVRIESYNAIEIPLVLIQ